MIDDGAYPRMPRAPRTLEETGLSFDLVQQVVSKVLHLAGDLTGGQLADRLGALFSVLAPCLEMMKRDRHCEISGGSLGPESYTYRLTEAGHSRANGYLLHDRYAGKLPVPLTEYRDYCKAFSRDDETVVSRQSVREAFGHLVLNDRILDQLGPAIAARHSLFIYGAAGTGKTVISQAIGKLLTGDIAIPHGLAVDTEVIRVFDPLIHQAVERRESNNSFQVDRDEDRRWKRCRRPVVTVGGELTMDSLELSYSASTGFYRAPVQSLANGGVLILDDFGRQRATPIQLLNRWIVPLESGIDHLTLRTGQKIQMPFDALVVFATNLNPRDLVDEAFLRRIQYKVHTEPPSQEEFIQIFERCCAQRKLGFDRRLVETLIVSQLESRNLMLRGCQPRDLIEHALTRAEYLEQPQELTPALMTAACDSYFLADVA